MGVKQTIKKSFWGKYLISLYHCAMCKLMPKLIDDEKAVKKFYKKKCGKELDLSDPKSFSEKINWYKLNDRNPLMQQCADKISVRDYITRKGYADCLNKVYGVYYRVEDIDFNSFPNQFVIKAAHGSHMNYIVKDKVSFDWKHAKKMIKTWLKQDIYWSGREWVYKDLPKRIIIEKYLEDKSGDLIDYKFFCFYGTPAFLQCSCNRFSDDIVQNFYDLDWNLLPFGKSIPHNPNYKVDKPHTFNDMVKIVKDLCSPFQFVRVDLYEANNKIYFGELTFFPGGGIPDFIPSEYDQTVGEMWRA